MFSHYPNCNANVLQLFINIIAEIRWLILLSNWILTLWLFS